jgi:hypothetical protein
MLSWLITTYKQKSYESSSLSLASLMSVECEWVRKNQRSRSFPDSNRDVYTFFPPLLARIAREKRKKKMVEARETESELRWKQLWIGKMNVRH